MLLRPWQGNMAIFLCNRIDHPANLLSRVLSTVLTFNRNLFSISQPIKNGISTGTTSTLTIIMLPSGTCTLIANIPKDFCLFTPKQNTVLEACSLNLQPTYLQYALACLSPITLFWAPVSRQAPCQISRGLFSEALKFLFRELPLYSTTFARYVRCP